MSKTIISILDADKQYRNMCQEKDCYLNSNLESYGEKIQPLLYEWLLNKCKAIDEEWPEDYLSDDGGERARTIHETILQFNGEHTLTDSKGFAYKFTQIALGLYVCDLNRMEATLLATLLIEVKSATRYETVLGNTLANALANYVSNAAKSSPEKVAEYILRKAEYQYFEPEQLWD